MVKIRAKCDKVKGAIVDANKSLNVYPKCVVEKSVNDWIDEAVGHGEPVDTEEDGVEEVLLASCLVDDQLGVEVKDGGEGVKRQPADGEERHDDDKHLDDLR